MKNFNTIIILLGILSASILIVENMLLNQQAFVYIWRNSTTSTLTIMSILTGIALGFGIKGKLGEKHAEESDEYNF